MSSYEHIKMSFDEFATLVAKCTNLTELNRIKQEIDGAIDYVQKTCRDRVRNTIIHHPLNLIDLGEHRQTVVDRWIVLASHSVA